MRYPGLESFPQHALAKEQASGFGAMLWFEVEGGVKAGKKLMDSVKLCTLAENLGSVETLITHPVTMTHAVVEPAERARVGITDGLVRLSVGIEDVEDLVADLREALAQALVVARCGHEKANASHASERGQAAATATTPSCRPCIAAVKFTYPTIADSLDCRGERARFRLHARLEPDDARARAARGGAAGPRRCDRGRLRHGRDLASLARQSRSGRSRRHLRRVVPAESRRRAALPAEARDQVHDARACTTSPASSRRSRRTTRSSCCSRPRRIRCCRCPISPRRPHQRQCHHHARVRCPARHVGLLHVGNGGVTGGTSRGFPAPCRRRSLRPACRPP